MDKENLSFEGVDPLTAVRTVLAWYWGDDGEHGGTLELLIRGLRLSEQFCKGNVSDFTRDDFWIFYDALASYRGKGPVLGPMSEQAQQGWEKS